MDQFYPIFSVIILGNQERTLKKLLNTFCCNDTLSLFNRCSEVLAAVIQELLSANHSAPGAATLLRYTRDHGPQLGLHNYRS